MTQETKNIYQKLLEIQKKNLTFTKNATNPYFHSKYLTLDELNKGLNPVLSELKLVIVHFTYKRKVTTRIVDTETKDNYIESIFPIPKEITDPQKMGSAITYAKRYNICQLLNIVDVSDDDANTASGKKEKQVDAEEVETPL